jgi:hypothetical protein
MTFFPEILNSHLIYTRCIGYSSQLGLQEFDSDISSTTDVVVIPPKLDFLELINVISSVM